MTNNDTPKISILPSRNGGNNKANTKNHNRTRKMSHSQTTPKESESQQHTIEEAVSSPSSGEAQKKATTNEDSVSVFSEISGGNDCDDDIGGVLCFHDKLETRLVEAGSSDDQGRHVSNEGGVTCPNNDDIMPSNHEEWYSSCSSLPFGFGDNWEDWDSLLHFNYDEYSQYSFDDQHNFLSCLWKDDHDLEAHSLKLQDDAITTSFLS